MTDNDTDETAARIGNLILNYDGPPTTGSLIPISIRPQDGVLSGDTNTSLVASMNQTDPIPPAPEGVVTNTGTATLWYFVRSTSANDPIEVRAVSSTLYTSQVTFPSQSNPTGLVLMTLHGNDILNSAGTSFAPPVTLDYLFLIVYVHVITEGTAADMEGYSVMPLKRASAPP